MPTTIKAENWDGVTAPAVPSGWTLTGWDDTGVTSATVSRSSPNSFKSPANNSNVVGGYWANNKDGNSGNAQVTMAFRMATAIATAGKQFSVICRAVNAPLTDCYRFVGRVGSSQGDLRVYVGGTPTNLIFGQAMTLAANIWYVVRLKTDGDNITVRIQRDSDSNYLTSSDTWQASAVDCMSVTDSTSGRPVTEGYGGFSCSNDDFPDAGNITYCDDFLFESLAEGGVQIGRLAGYML